MCVLNLGNAIAGLFIYHLFYVETEKYIYFLLQVLRFVCTGTPGACQSWRILDSKYLHPVALTYLISTTTLSHSLYLVLSLQSTMLNVHNI